MDASDRLMDLSCPPNIIFVNFNPAKKASKIVRAASVGVPSVVSSEFCFPEKLRRCFNLHTIFKALDKSNWLYPEFNRYFPEFTHFHFQAVW